MELRRDQKDILVLREKVDRLVKNAHASDRLLWNSLRSGIHVR